MNLTHLRTFQAVASEGSFTGAARRLSITQPAVSMLVRALEEEYAVELVARQGRKISLTPLGQALSTLAQRILSLDEEATELLRSAKALKGGQLRVGADAPAHVILRIAAFHRRYPAVKVTLSIGSSSSVHQDLVEGRLDVAVLAELPDDGRLYALRCAEHAIVAFVHRQHPWAERESIRIEELKDVPLVLREAGSITRRTIEHAMSIVGIIPQVALEMDSREAVREAVAAGLGVGFVSAGELGKDSRVVPIALRDLDLKNTESLACLASRRNLRAIRAFLSSTLLSGVAPALDS